MNFEEFVKDKDICFLAKGWRGEVYTFKEGNEQFCIKKAIHQEAFYAIQKEANILSCLYKDIRFPQIVCQGEDFFVYKYIDAKPFEKVFWLLEKENQLKVLKSILEAAYYLDSVGINRGEFDKEYKNILIDDALKIYILDFDRGNFSKNPKNITQFIQSIRVKGLLTKEEAISLGKIYKSNRDDVYNYLNNLLSQPPSTV
ncbi:serine/threonine protein kinase [Hydrogenobaculum acidophilum]